MARGIAATSSVCAVCSTESGTLLALNISGKISLAGKRRRAAETSERGACKRGRGGRSVSAARLPGSEVPMTMRIYDDEVKPATRERCLEAEPLSRATVRSFLTLLCCMLLLLLPESKAKAEASRSLSVASDGPGALSYFDLARKDCIGTARNTTSKVWFTLADGVLSDVYFPTVDNTNVKTLQYIVTDGRTFTDL